MTHERASTGAERPPRRKPRHYGPVPKLRTQSWQLTVCGETYDAGVHVITWEQLLTLPMREVEGDVLCAEAGHGRRGLWRGVPAAEVLALVPPDPGASSVLAAAAYGFSSTLRLADLQARDTLLAIELDGDPLPPEHGGPVRLLAPHLYGWKNVKWLLEVSYRSTPEPGFWESRGYHMVGDVASGFVYAHQG